MEGCSLTAGGAPAMMDREAASDAAAPDSRVEKEQQQREAAAGAAGQWRGGGGAVPVPARRGRWLDEEPPTTTTAAAGWRCRSCAAVAIADCVALGCCPCAVVSVLALVLLKAPLVVGRRCVGRLRRRRRFLRLHKKKRVRDVAAASSAAKTTTTITATAACVIDKGAGKAETRHPPSEGRMAAEVEATVAPSAPAPGQAEAAELAWVDEMYRVGHWGFGRVSFAGEDIPRDGASVS